MTPLCSLSFLYLLLSRMHKSCWRYFSTPVKEISFTNDVRSLMGLIRIDKTINRNFLPKHPVTMTSLASTLVAVSKQGRSHKLHSYYVSNHNKPTTLAFISNYFMVVCCTAHCQQSTQTNPKQRLGSSVTSTSSTTLNSGTSKVISSNNIHVYEAFLDKLVNQCNAGKNALVQYLATL